MADEKSLLQEFKAFVLRGNVVDLAVAVVIGAAFGAVVNALVKDLITPVVAAVFGKSKVDVAWVATGVERAWTHAGTARGAAKPAR